MFITENDACRFLVWYADQYGVVNTSHLELYQAELSVEEFGRRYLDKESEHSEEPPEQADFAAFEPAMRRVVPDRGR